MENIAEQITPSINLDRKQQQDLQLELLTKVSRTFALTIPQLPKDLQIVVSNAYLLCRMADTIEDTNDLESKHKDDYLDLFVQIVAGNKKPNLIKPILKYLDNKTPIAERELMALTPEILAITYSFSKAEQNAIAKCISRMCKGMHKFEKISSIAGLKNLRALDSYCYAVAGVVGELLSELFCIYSPTIRNQQSELFWLGASFGQGLQMTNILKDFWEDRERGACFLPQDVFYKYGIKLDTLNSQNIPHNFAKAYQELIAIANAHLKNALSYTLLLPKKEDGIRKFCLWAIWFAIYTLRNIQKKPYFTSGKEVKISRSLVKSIIIKTNILAKWDKGLSHYFNIISKPLPFIPLSYDWDPNIFLQQIE